MVFILIRVGAVLGGMVLQDFLTNPDQGAGPPVGEKLLREVFNRGNGNGGAVR